MGEQIKKNTLALYGDRETNLSFRNSSDSWTKGEDNPEIVERSGFVPLRNRVLALMQSGERLLQARKDAFRYAEDEEPEDFEVDETLQCDYGELDALTDLRVVTERLKRKARARNEENAGRDNKPVGDSVSDSSTGKNEMTKPVGESENAKTEKA